MVATAGTPCSMAKACYCASTTPQRRAAQRCQPDAYRDKELVDMYIYSRRIYTHYGYTIWQRRTCSSRQRHLGHRKALLLRALSQHFLQWDAQEMARKIVLYRSFFRAWPVPCK